MTCHGARLPGGGTAIVCGARPRQRCACGKKAALLCDWKVPARASGTCDKPLCVDCAFEVAPGKDLCPDHRRAFAEWIRKERGPE